MILRMVGQVQIFIDLEAIVCPWVRTEPIAGNLESSGELMRVPDGREVPPAVAPVQRIR